MDTNVLTALLALIGTAVGSLGGIMASSKLTNHRLAQLEKKVEQHNNLVERMVEVEQKVKSHTQRLDNIKLN